MADSDCKPDRAGTAPAFSRRYPAERERTRTVHSKSEPAFAKWVPKAARAQIVQKLAETELPPDVRSLCVRLAEHPEMKRVWEAWPKPLTGYEDALIGRVVWIYQLAISLPRPRPRNRRDFEEFLKHNRIVTVTAESVAFRARWLIDGVLDQQADARFVWEKMWPGESSMTLDKLIALIEQSATFYEHIWEERQKLIAASALPPVPKKLGAKSASETWFSRAMSEYFMRYIGKSLDVIVDTLTDVAFDLKGDLVPGLARSRRRSAAAHSRKKSK